MKGACDSLTWIVIAALAALSAGVAVAQVSAEQPAEELIVEDIVAWVNDDIVRLSQLVESEQAVIARLLRDQQVTAEDIESRIAELRESLMLQSIWDRLLAQQAERLFDEAGCPDCKRKEKREIVCRTCLGDAWRSGFTTGRTRMPWWK